MASTGHFVPTNGVPLKSSDIFLRCNKNVAYLSAILGAALCPQYHIASVKINCLTSKN